MQAAHAQMEAAQLNDILMVQQSQLDRQAREALRAAMGLEHCATTLASKAGEPVCDGRLPVVMASSIQAEMAKCLGILKESLWQLLVLATNDKELSK